MASTIETVKAIIKRDLKLSDSVVLADNMPLIGGDLDVDSLDVLLLLSSLEKQFGFKITSESVDRSAFASIATLAAYIEKKRSENGPATVAAAVDLSGLLARLPHGPPLRFVSRLIEVEAGRSGRGVWQVTGQEDFFKGHFPDRPIVPGVLIGEALAQMAGLVGASDPKSAATQGRLAKLDLRFRQAVVPPADIELVAKLDKAMGHLMHFNVEARVAGPTVADGALTLNLGTGE